MQTVGVTWEALAILDMGMQKPTVLRVLPSNQGVTTYYFAGFGATGKHVVKSLPRHPQGDGRVIESLPPGLETTVSRGFRFGAWGGGHSHSALKNRRRQDGGNCNVIGRCPAVACPDEDREICRRRRSQSHQDRLISETKLESYLPKPKLQNQKLTFSALPHLSAHRNPTPFE